MGKLQKQVRRLTFPHVQEEKKVVMCLRDYRQIGYSDFKPVMRVLYGSTKLGMDVG